MKKDKEQFKDKRTRLDQQEYLPKYWFVQEGWERMFDVALPCKNKSDKSLVASQ